MFRTIDTLYCTVNLICIAIEMITKNVENQPQVAAATTKQTTQTNFSRI